MAEVGLGRVGLALGLEVSRLARNSSDWHQLLEIYALTHTLILDEEELYARGSAGESRYFASRCGGQRNRD